MIPRPQAISAQQPEMCAHASPRRGEGKALKRLMFSPLPSRERAGPAKREGEGAAPTYDAISASARAMAMASRKGGTRGVTSAGPSPGL